MSGFLRIALGIITSMGGFLEAGSISTSAQAGAMFGFQLLWAGVLAAVALAFLLEMTGRLAAVSGHTFADAIRERFGFPVHAGLLGLEILLDTLLLTAEIGGVSLALHLATGVAFRWWVVPTALAVWLVLWLGTFGMIEDGVSMFGLVALAFVVAVVRLHAPVAELGAGLVPRLPGKERATYGFQAVAILGATVSPYLLNFYSSGAVEERWDEGALRSNRVVAWVGTAFGAVISLAILVVSGLVLAPAGVRVEKYDEAAVMLTPAFGRWGFALFVATLAVGCFGAALEVSLNFAYLLAQALGWNWGEDEVPRKNARFCLAYTVFLVPPTLIMLTGIPPLRVTLLTMVLTVMALPLIVLPLLVIMNDPLYLKRHTNGRMSNVLIAVIVVAGALMALVAAPLAILGGE